MNEMEEVPTLTGHPVVVQFALQVLLAGHERLQGELQLLPVERLLHAEILRGNTTERHLLRALRRCSASLLPSPARAATPAAAFVRI